MITGAHKKDTQKYLLNITLNGKKHFLYYYVNVKFYKFT